MPSIDKIRLNNTDYDIGNNNTYSTDEQVVGTWIDGKPLYRKTYSYNVSHSDSSSVQTYEYNHNIANVDTIWIDRGKSYSGGGLTPLDNVYYNTITGQISIFTRGLVDTTKITYNIYRNTTYVDNVKITVLYTKTTDTVS